MLIYYRFYNNVLTLGLQVRTGIIFQYFPSTQGITITVTLKIAAVVFQQIEKTLQYNLSLPERFVLFLEVLVLY